MKETAAVRLADGVALRRERFGGLVYRYDNRRLYFIHSPLTVTFLAGLDGKRPLRQAVGEFLAANATGTISGDTLRRTVDQLETMGIVTADSRGGEEPHHQRPDVAEAPG